MYKKLTLLGLLLITLVAAKMTCSAAELLQKTNFRDGLNLPWVLQESAEENSYSKVVDGEYLVHMDKAGTNKWDVQIRHRGISLVAGHKYIVHFKLRVKSTQKIYVKIGDQGDPYWEAWNNNWNSYTVGPAGLNVTETFTSAKSSLSAEFAFHFGGELATIPNEIYFGEMSLQDDQFVPTPAPTATPPRDIRVNQLGYYPNAAKKATLISSSNSALDVQLKDSTGKVVWAGTSQPGSNFDKASGDIVHIIDFSDFKEVGKGFQLFSGTASSFPFDIGTDIYSQMKYDALKYFYYVRSGIELTMPYCVDLKWSRSWARPAGHPNDIVTLFPGKPYSDGLYTGGPETIDGSGGWYDGGDHGKYLLNGGLATWYLQNQYELSKVIDNDSQYADGKMNIPESGNGVPDILDEARWNMEFMLKAQIPAGYNKAGMAIYKIGDKTWTETGVSPDQDLQSRYYYPPSTESTLYLAATAAQASRLWKDYDKEFSEKCLTSAETAWKAAVAHPDVYTPSSSLNVDNNMSDNFYWAACELYATTCKTEYYDYIKSSPCSLKMSQALMPNLNDIFLTDYKDVTGLGSLTLSIVGTGSSMSTSDLSTLKANILTSADDLISIQQREGYGIPLQLSTYNTENSGQLEIIPDAYGWGSNLVIANNCIIIAYAYELSRDSKYLKSISEAMDYLMGRNPLIKCYVTGYGDNPVKNPFSYLFPGPIEPFMPKTPPGFLVSGPNSAFEDLFSIGGIVRRTLAQKCYIDNAGSWSTNQVTLNLNASLAWIIGFLDGTLKTSEQPPRWDINIDGAVNMADVMLIAGCFNSKKGDPNYDEKCDLNNDGAINMSDVMMVAKYFGKVYKYDHTTQ